MSKHTPGPWVADNGEGYGEAGIWRIQPPIGSNVKIVAEMICDSAEAEANARLIAAAPEMLELLRDLRRYVADANLRGDGYAEIDLKAIDALLATMGEAK